MRIGVAAIVKNEAPYLLEWVAFHQTVGVTDFFVADNDSTDGTAELLTDLEAKGQIVGLRFPGLGQQIRAYNAILAAFRHRCDWIAILDADEFIVPQSGSLPEYLGKFTDTTIGAVTVNWALYGSSGHETRAEGLVMERFVHRAHQKVPRNRLCKSIVRPAAISAIRNTTRSPLREGFIEVTSDGVPTDPLVPLTARRCVWSGIRVNHYAIKSREEFLTNKQPRGLADKTDGSLRPDDFFAKNDFNDVYDPMPATLVAATKGRMRHLASQGSAHTTP